MRRSAWAAGLVVALLGLAPPAGASPAPAQQIAARLHTQLSDLAKTGVFSGELLVTRGSERLLHATFSPPGTAGPPAGACYRIASITKSFTATAILLLAERGQLTLDDAIADHVPVLDRRGFTKDGQAVTLDHLLTHTSGLTGIVMAPPWGRQFTTAELAASFADAEVSHRPGTHYQYSNPGYVLLGQVIERKSGKTYEAFVRDEIAGPLGLGHTGITRSLDPCPLMPGQVASALGLHNAREVFSDVLVGDYVWSGGSSGALYANVDDLVRFVQALPAGQLLRRASVDRLWAPHLDDYARGFVVEALPSIDRKLVWHNGELSPLGYQSFLGHFPDDGLTFAVLANVDSTGFGLTPIVFGALADRPPPADPEGRSKRLHVTARVLHLGPAMALLLFAGLYAVTRWRPASWAKTLASASATFMLAVVVLGLFTPKWIFVGGTAATAVASVALVVAARSRSSRKMDTVVAGLMTVFALTVAALALGIRLILMSR